MRLVEPVFGHPVGVKLHRIDLFVIALIGTILGLVSAECVVAMLQL